MDRSVKINYIYSTFYQILSIILPLATTPYISRVLSVDSIGVYSFTGSIVSYFVLVASFSFQTYGQREAAYKKNDKEKFVKVVKILVDNQNSNAQVTSVLHVLNDCDAVGDMHFIEDRDYFRKIAKRMEQELEV